MKKFLLGLVIDMAIDYFIRALRELAKKSSTDIDDNLVDEVESYRNDIIDLVKHKL